MNKNIDFKKIFNLFLLLIFFIIFIFFILNLSRCTESTISPSPKNHSNALQQAALINTQLGMAYFSQGKTMLAEAKLSQALSQFPNSPEVNDAMAYVLWKTGELAQARVYYQKAEKLAPKDPYVENAEGVFLCETGDFSLGIQQFDQALAAPHFFAKGLTAQNAGSCAYLEKNAPLAMTYFLKALSEDPALPLSDLRLAELYFNNKNYPRAKFYLSKFNAIADPTPESKKLSAMLLVKMGH